MSEKTTAALDRATDLIEHAAGALEDVLTQGGFNIDRATDLVAALEEINQLNHSLTETLMAWRAEDKRPAQYDEKRRDMP